MKILHTADWHIGQFKGPVVDGVNLRSQDTVKCLEYMVQVAIEEKPDIVCVSGDIFHQEQVGPVRYSDEMITATNIITSLAHAAELVFKYVYRAYRKPDDEEAREKMCEASLIAGLAFTLPKTTSSHACSFPLTNIYHIPHGEACGLTLDYFIRINAKGEGGERVEEFARRIGFKDAEEMADAVLELKKKMGLRCDLKDLELDDDQIAELVRISRHPNLYNNPVEITDEMLDEMYRYLSGK